MSGPWSLRRRSNSFGAMSRYLAVDHTVSAGSSLSAGSYAVLRFEMP
jgi:hypothetical protein